MFEVGGEVKSLEKSLGHFVFLVFNLFFFVFYLREGNT